MGLRIAFAGGLEMFAYRHLFLNNIHGDSSEDFRSLMSISNIFEENAQKTLVDLLRLL